MAHGISIAIPIKFCGAKNFVKCLSFKVRYMTSPSPPLFVASWDSQYKHSASPKLLKYFCGSGLAPQNFIEITIVKIKKDKKRKFLRDER
jgi:hypothetical protein